MVVTKKERLAEPERGTRVELRGRSSEEADSGGHRDEGGGTPEYLKRGTTKRLPWKFLRGNA